MEANDGIAIVIYTYTHKHLYLYTPEYVYNISVFIAGKKERYSVFTVPLLFLDRQVTLKRPKI